MQELHTKQPVHDIAALSEEVNETRSGNSGQGGRECIYDFRHPNALSQAQHLKLQTIHEEFSRAQVIYLTSLFKNAQVLLKSVDQLLYSEYISSLADPACIWKIGLQDGAGFGLMEFSSEMMLVIIDRVLGGLGGAVNESKKLTRLEQSVAGKIVDKILGLYNEAWKKTVPLNAKIMDFESNPRYLQVASREDIVVLFFFEVRLAEKMYPVNICIPFRIIDHLIARDTAETKRAGSLKKQKLEDQFKIEQVLMASNIDLRILLGEATLTVEELLNLETNDILILNTKTDEPCLAQIGDRQRCLGTVGVNGNKLAYKIVEMLENTDLERNPYGGKNPKVR